VPAWERFSSKVPAKGAVWCQRIEPAGGLRKDHKRGSHSRQTSHSKGFWEDEETERDLDVTNRGFPHQRCKPSKLRPTLTESSTP